MTITIFLPDEIAERVRKLPDCNEFVTRAVEEALAREQSSGPPSEEKPSKWARIVKRIESQPSLGSYAETFNADRREFRRDFQFPHDQH